MNKYIFASSNKGKLKEISHQLSKIDLIGLEQIGYLDEIIENGNTLEENAFIKSDTIYKHYNMSCISDDSGLEVYALGNAPGVFSARYAGKEANAEDNIRKLLKEMQYISDRRARFRTVLCLISSTEKKFFEGIVEGFIATHKIGVNGFGYDPIFIPNGSQKTFAQMSLNEKQQISHRSKAIAKLAQHLAM